MKVWRAFPKVNCISQSVSLCMQSKWKEAKSSGAELHIKIPGKELQGGVVMPRRPRGFVMAGKSCASLLDSPLTQLLVNNEALKSWHWDHTGLADS